MEKRIFKFSYIYGIGFAVLFLDKENGRLFHKIINDKESDHLEYGVPILVVDVMEDAYYKKLAINEDVDKNSFFENIDWDIVQKRYEIAKK